MAAKRVVPFDKKFKHEAEEHHYKPVEILYIQRRKLDALSDIIMKKFRVDRLIQGEWDYYPDIGFKGDADEEKDNFTIE